MTNVLVLGSGGREHALAWRTRMNPVDVNKIYISPGNGGTPYSPFGGEPLGCNVSLNGFGEIADFVRENKIGLTVVGPEAPLVDGIVNYFEDNGLIEEGYYIFGPTREATMLTEGSKANQKNLMKEIGVPTADFEVFIDLEKAKDYIADKGAPGVAKADKIAAGKGSVVYKTIEAGYEAVDWLMGEEFNKKYNGAGRKIVIEEFMPGEEATIQALTDGKTFRLLASSQDHKAVYDGDKGPNTGGMGAYAPAPVVTKEVEKRVRKEIVEPLIKELGNRGTSYVGCLYPGLMIEDGKPRVVELNSRFGDPEAQVVLPLLETDLYRMMTACVEGNLDEYEIKNKEGAACCVVMASGGYPDSYEKGKLIRGLDDVKVPVFHAGTKREGNKVLTNGGRVLGVTSVAPDIKSAISGAYRDVDKITWEKEYHRTDIGRKALRHLG